MNRARSNFHLESMELSSLLNLLQMLVVTVLRKPCDDIFVRPVDLEGVAVIVVDMILLQTFVSN